jgi:hypothetical protein
MSDESNIPHTLTGLSHSSQQLGMPMGVSFSSEVPRAEYAAGANRDVMSAPLADFQKTTATAMFFDIANPADKLAPAGALTATFTESGGDSGSKSVEPMLAGAARTSIGRVGEPGQQEFTSQGPVTDSTSI